MATSTWIESAAATPKKPVAKDLEKGRLDGIELTQRQRTRMARVVVRFGRTARETRTPMSCSRFLASPTRTPCRR